MSDNARLKEIQEKITNNVQLQLKKFMDAMEIRDRDHASRIDNIEMGNEGRLNRIETAVESLLTRAVEIQRDEENSRRHQAPFHTRSVKLEFPRFDGTHAIEWIFKAEQFFEYYNTPDEDRLTIAAVHLDQKVVPWYQMMQRTNPFQSWQLFARAIEVDFGPSCYDCPRATLFKLTQK
ncbi:retrotransposon-derived protein PEG10-like, partial [Trifolium medium]|nr:retrotransposon-derived protein PEG10-like [Trifolium medium]